MAAEAGLILASRSAAEDLAFIALADVAAVVAERGVEDARIIGGHMVMLHVYRRGLGADLYRTTADADLGVPPFVAREAGVIEALEGRGYARFSGNRFRRRVAELEPRVEAPYAVVDILVPTYTSRARDNVEISDKLTTIEVPGLAFALARPPVQVRLDAVLTAGAEIPLSVVLPDEVSAFVLKALAWNRRAAGKDAVDVWRMLEVLRASGISLAGCTSEDVQSALEAVASAFNDTRAAGTAAMAQEQGLSETGLRDRWTRIQALIRSTLLGPAP